MSYGFNQDTQSESTAKYFNAGITPNVELESVEFKSAKKDGTGEPVLMFNFKGENGETFRHIEWDVKDAQDLAKAQEALGKRVKHIITKFIPEEKAILSGNTYAEFSQGVINLLGDSFKGKKVAIKLVYGSKEYPKQNYGFTKYTGFIANDAKDLRIGDKELLTKPSANPSSNTELENSPADPTLDF